MKEELELKVQAYLDGELSQSEAAVVRRQLEQEPELSALLNELRATSALVRENELVRRLPEAGEFYWSKIEREIARESANEAGSATPWPWWMKWFAPVAGAALAVVLVFGLQEDSGQEKVSDWIFAQEIESPAENANIISFYSKSDNMTVVWVDTSGN